MIKIGRENNIDIIRLLAALQVMLYHGIEHCGLNDMNVVYGVSYKILSYFHGVPIFFAISGFLIPLSFERSATFKKYILNRTLRLYPALWVCFIFTFLLLIIFKEINLSTLSQSTFYIWLVGQLSFLQFYTPEFFKDFGLGNPNGNLWTIVVELQFYLIVPMVYFFKRNSRIVLILLLMLTGYLVNYIVYDNRSFIISKLIIVSVIPYLFYFGMGMLIYEYFDKIRKYFDGRFIPWLVVYITYCLVTSWGMKLFVPSYSPNLFGLIGDAILIILVFSLAFSAKSFSNRILRGNDISYGVYLYHGVILNALISLSFPNQEAVFYSLLISSILLGYLSWRFVEKKALKLKHKI